MAGPTKEKRQQSLTSFFTPKTVNATPRTPLGQAHEPANSNVHVDSFLDVPQKRPLEEDTDNGNPAPVRKKSKSTLVERQSTTLPRSKAESLPVATRPSQPNARTERYLYDGSSPRDGQHTVNEDEQQQDDAEEKRRKEVLHRKFVQKLGRPDSIALMKRRNHQIDDETHALNNEDGEEEEEDDTPQPTKARKKGAKTGKLTPMEIQFLDIKRKHTDTLLIVEVGYKFKFFGEDARIAAKELSIVCIPGKLRYDEHPSEAHLDRFASASIPVHRLPVHAKRLVAAGHKVGVVRQIETAALKKVGDNRNAPFTRKLTNVYTKGTYIDEVGELDQQTDATTPAGGYLLCITETAAKGWGTDEKVDVGIIAVQPATGDIIYDIFEDGFMRSEIETRLLHISPCEFLIVGELSKATDKLIQHLSGSSTNVFGDRSRVERIAKSKTLAAEAYSHVTQFYSNKLKENEGDDHASALLNKVLKLPEAVTICLSSMINHLKEYGLEHIFDLTKYFQSFSARQHMLINGTTLESLEVYRNQTDHSEKGSLFWALDKTLTRFGQRLLRKWVGRPLLDKERLEERVAAVEELLNNASTAKVDQLEHTLKTTKTDLERSLIRIYYGKCTRPELLAVLQTLQRIASEFTRVKDSSDAGFSSAAISEAIASLPLILPTVLSYLERINAEAARADDKYAFFRETEETEAITDHKLGIASVEQELDAHRKVASSKLNKKSPVSYVTVAGIEYLVEVANSDLKHVPASWIKISGTKKLSRFHTPEVVRLISERDQHKEALSAACDVAFASLLRSIASEYQPIRDAISSLATLDCLLSLSKVAALPGYTKPDFLPSDTPPTISVTAGRYPIAEQTLATSYIPFSTTLASPTPLAHLITGPNMGGKSSFVRAVALLVLLAQIGSYVPADSLSLTLVDAIHTRMGARDNLFRGESTFMVEVSETARILRSATPRSLVILDELGRGTSTYDGAAIAQAVLQHVVEDIRCLTLFITHYQSLARVADGLAGRCTNVHMRFTAANKRRCNGGNSSMIESQDEDLGRDEGHCHGDEEITFLYEVGEGVAHRSYGLNVARLARIPRRVLDVAAQKSQQLEDEIKRRRLGGATKLLADVLANGSDQLDHLVSSIEQL
ncbi:muts domain V-domain-containing protein [Xylaria bambusicola]|uniref:muts domain V-domain-containing protein n=1 Tax=Xylaria bambusicola TaxID=326684 RepID=UPI00200758C4|nr:muts domain V-domain-containing protein [Xylaria bambusicola]KAI0515216.1 muts domain V-domain-containing protein [Xylaria bambusicola]